MNPRLNKRVAEGSSPLSEPSVLRRVFAFAGRCEWLFLAAVNNLWAEEYAATFSGSHLKMAQRANPRLTSFRKLFGSVSRLQLAQECGLGFNAAQLQVAAGRYADIPTLAAAAQVFSMPWKNVILGAALIGSVSKLQWLRTEQHYEIEDPDSLAMYAVAGGSVDVLNWLKEQGVSFPINTWHCAAATKQNQLQVAQFLHAEGVEWTSDCCEKAAAAGNLEALRFMHEHDCPWNRATVRTAAAENGSIEVMSYLQQEGLLYTVPKLTEMLSVAALHNNLEASKWLRQQGAAWPAVLQTSGKVLTWAKSEGCFSATSSSSF
jgi:hypothetical protein